MSITIHHGPNGSYKTAGVVNDYFIPAARAGRLVVTNIRGITRERTLMHLEDVPESFDVIAIDTETREGRYKIATWFHWAPPGALCLFDESGVMFPKAWRQKDIDALDYPGGPDAAAAADRPVNWIEAWEMHRHWNWDIVVSAPNIKSLRDDIRGTTEGAYKHKNKAVLGPMFNGYKEGYHDAQKNGQSASDFDVIRDKRVDPMVFRLYDSTKTGKAQETLNGFNLFTSPRVLLTLGVASLAIGWSIYSGILSVFSSPLGNSEAQPVVQAPVPVDPPPVQVPDPVNPTPRNNDSDHVDTGPDRKGGTLGAGPLAGHELWISGYLQAPHKMYYTLSVMVDGGPVDYLASDLRQMGYHFNGYGRCYAEVSFRGDRYPVTCVQLVRSEERNVERPNDSPPATLADSVVF